MSDDSEKELNEVPAPSEPEKNPEPVVAAHPNSAKPDEPAGPPESSQIEEALANKVPPAPSEGDDEPVESDLKRKPPVKDEINKYNEKKGGTFEGGELNKRSALTGEAVGRQGGAQQRSNAEQLRSYQFNEAEEAFIIEQMRDIHRHLNIYFDLSRASGARTTVAHNWEVSEFEAALFRPALDFRLKTETLNRLSSRLQNSSTGVVLVSSTDQEYLNMVMGTLGVEIHDMGRTVKTLRSVSYEVIMSLCDQPEADKDPLKDLNSNWYLIETCYSVFLERFSFADLERLNNALSRRGIGFLLGICQPLQQIPLAWRKFHHELEKVNTYQQFQFSLEKAENLSEEERQEIQKLIQNLTDYPFIVDNLELDLSYEEILKLANQVVLYICGKIKKEDLLRSKHQRLRELLQRWLKTYRQDLEARSYMLSLAFLNALPADDIAVANELLLKYFKQRYGEIEEAQAQVTDQNLAYQQAQQRRAQKLSRHPLLEQESDLLEQMMAKRGEGEFKMMDGRLRRVTIIQFKYEGFYPLVLQHFWEELVRAREILLEWATHLLQGYSVTDIARWPNYVSHTAAHALGIISIFDYFTIEQRFIIPMANDYFKLQENYAIVLSLIELLSSEENIKEFLLDRESQLDALKAFLQQQDPIEYREMIARLEGTIRILAARKSNADPKAEQDFVADLNQSIKILAQIIDDLRRKRDDLNLEMLHLPGKISNILWWSYYHAPSRSNREDIQDLLHRWAYDTWLDENQKSNPAYRKIALATLGRIGAYFYKEALQDLDHIARLGYKKRPPDVDIAFVVRIDKRGFYEAKPELGQVSERRAQQERDYYDAQLELMEKHLQRWEEQEHIYDLVRESLFGMMTETVVMAFSGYQTFGEQQNPQNLSKDACYAILKRIEVWVKDVETDPQVACMGALALAQMAGEEVKPYLEPIEANRYKNWHLLMYVTVQDERALGKMCAILRIMLRQPGHYQELHEEDAGKRKKKEWQPHYMESIAKYILKEAVNQVPIQKGDDSFQKKRTYRYCQWVFWELAFGEASELMDKARILAFCREQAAEFKNQQQPVWQALAEYIEG